MKCFPSQRGRDPLCDRSHVLRCGVMTIDRAEVVADAMLDTWRDFIDAHPDGWASGGDGLQACATGIPSVGLNGVWSSRLDPDPAELERLLGELEARKLPHMLQLRP